ncbi:MAG: EAL domain-containing protein [Pseudomonadota bacterium]|nr:EAL domain-containing protein [Pseudomonadota bacterium]
MKDHPSSATARRGLAPGLVLAAIFAVQVLAAAALVVHGQRLLADSHQQRQEQAVQARSALLAETLAPSLDNGRRGLVLDTLERLRDDLDLRYAAVYNTRLERLASLGEPPPLGRAAFSAIEYRQRRQDGLIAVEQPVGRGGRTLGLMQAGFGTAAVDRLMDEAARRQTLIALLGVLAGGGLLLFLGLGLGADLRRLRAGLRALGEGEYGQRIAAGPLRPLGSVAAAVNRLAARLQAQRDVQRGRYEQWQVEVRRLNALLHGIGAVAWEVDPATGRFRYVSDQAQRLLGFPAAEWLGGDFLHRHVHPNDLEWLEDFLSHPGNPGTSHTMDFRIFNKSGDRLWLRMFSSVELGERGCLLSGLLLDVTEEKTSEQRIAYLADHDSLTGLINRRRFQERLDEQISYSRRYGPGGALLFIDLDQFKYVNDTYGHHTGDEYLRQVSQHLRNTLRKSDILGRLGGDEFGVILPNSDREHACQAAAVLLKTLNTQEFIFEGRRTHFGASIGVALFPAHGQRAGDLLARADSAMYSAKEQGRNTYRLFEESIDAARMKGKVHWEDRIRDALRNDRLRLFFQPIVELESGIIRHYETLLRMVGEAGEIIGPSAFIGIAERFGMIRDIDRWVVEQAIRAQGASRQTSMPVALTVNLSGRHFGSLEILDLVQEATQRYQASPDHIVFEVTETAAVEKFTDACDFIEALRAKGYRFALDDFGAGFSSFHYLKHIPVDYVKIDGSFVRNLHRDRADRIFVKAIAEMAHALEVVPIAEFVENRETVEILKDLGVPLGQGYHFARPGPEFCAGGRIGG